MKVRISRRYPCKHVRSPVQAVARAAGADLEDGAGWGAHPHHPAGEPVHGAHCLPAHADLRDLPGRPGGVAAAHSSILALALACKQMYTPLPIHARVRGHVYGSV